MTLPLFTMDDDNALFWQQQRSSTAAQQQQMSEQNTITDSATEMLRPEEQAESELSRVANIGQTTTQGVLGSIATQQQKAAEEQQAEFRRQQEQALQDLKSQQEQQYKEMQKQYLDMFIQQQEEMTGQWEAYNKQKDLWKAGVNTQVTKFKNGNVNQIAQLARNAGFPESQIPLAVAIAMAESGGRANASNFANSNGSADFGLMQINSVHSKLLKTHDWRDPQQNMNMAFQIWKEAGGKWTPWAAYNNGSAAKFLQQGIAASKASQPVTIQPYMTQTEKGLRQAIVSTAKQYIGVPYVWGGNDLSKGVDCSGLVQQVYKQFGIALPRVAREQVTKGIRTSIGNLQPGDLVGWNPNFKAGQNYVGHIAIYVGNGMILEAQQKGVPVHVRALSKHDNVFGVKLDLAR